MKNILYSLLLFISAVPGFAQLYVTENGAGNGTGRSWSNAISAINFRAYLDYVSSGNEFWVAAGTYTPNHLGDRSLSFFIPSGVKVYGGFAGNETSREQRNPRQNHTVLSGDIGTLLNNTDNSYHVVRFKNADNTTILDGFTIQSGNASSVVFSDANSRGGAVYNDGSGTGNSSKPRIENCRFISNNATYGGAIHNFGDDHGDSSPTIVNCSFQGNTAEVGGGVYNYGIFGNSSPSFTNCIFSGNKAMYGAAVHNGGDAGICSPIFMNCSFAGNYATNDAAVMFNSGNTGTVKITNCIMWGNSSTITNSGGTNLISYSILQGTCPAGSTCSNNLSTDPLFVEQPDYTIAPSLAGDLHLQTFSPAYDAGTNTDAPVFDFDSNLRPYNYSTTDIGAYELQLIPVVPPTGVNVDKITICSGSGITLTATCKYGMVMWYNSTSGNNYIGTASPAVHIPTETKTYYATCKALNFETERVLVGTVVVNSYSSRLYVDSAATGTNTGQTWNDAYTDLQTALKYTCNNNLTEVWVAAGTYKPTVTDSTGISFIIPSGLKVYGGFAGNETALNQRQWKVNISILSGNIGNSSDSTDNSAYIVKFKNVSDSTRLDGFRIISGYGGGGILNDGSGANNKSNPIIANCIIANNYSNVEGGGLRNYAPYSGECSPAILNCSFLNNKGTYGGALANFGFAGKSSPVINNCVFSGNSTTSGAGGAVYNYGQSGVSSPVYTNCLFSGNKSNFGSAVYNIGQSGVCLPVFNNCTFSANYSRFTRATIYDILSTSTLNNSIVWGNSGGFDNNMGSATINNSIIQDGCPIGYTCNNVLDEDAKFTHQPDFYSTPTLAGDFHLTKCSPAIDKGTNSNLSAFDLEGLPRRFNNGIVDMGVYEYGGESIITIITDFNKGITAQVNAAVSISAANKIEPEASITYQAGKSITLSPGFIADANSVFKAQILNECVN